MQQNKRILYSVGSEIIVDGGKITITEENQSKYPHYSGITYQDMENFEGYFFGLDLKQAYLKSFDFSECILENLVLEKTDLSGANLIGSNIQNSDFNNANLKETDFRGSLIYESNFSEADLSKADLTGTEFSNCNLDSTNLSEAYYDEYTHGLSEDQIKDMIFVDNHYSSILIEL